MGSYSSIQFQHIQLADSCISIQSLLSRRRRFAHVAIPTRDISLSRTHFSVQMPIRRVQTNCVCVLDHLIIVFDIQLVKILKAVDKT